MRSLDHWVSCVFYDLFHIIHPFLSWCFSLDSFFWLISSLIPSFSSNLLLKSIYFLISHIVFSVLDFSSGFLKVLKVFKSSGFLKVSSSSLKFYNLSFSLFSILIIKSTSGISSTWTFCGFSSIVVFFFLFHPHLSSVLFLFLFLFFECQTLYLKKFRR